jgi:predicted phosphodiesterase
MKRAIVSDIHGNLEALTAVIADLEQQGVEQVVCLGDSVGYGPNPGECLDWALAQSVCLLGNAEESVLFEPSVGGEAGNEVMAWTRAALFSGDSAARRRESLERLPRVAYLAGALCVHASPRNPLHEYLLAREVESPERFDSLFRLTPDLAFVGHTHLPGFFTETREFYSSAQRPRVQRVGGRLIVNVGSVGQSRDGDRRACYVVWEENQLEFRRVAYDIESTVTKIRQTPALAQAKATRWLVGESGT